MRKSGKLKTIIQFLVLCITVIGFSIFITSVWVQEKETLPEKQELVVEESMTITEFGQKNSLSKHILQEAFELQETQDLEKKMGDLKMTAEQISTKVDKAKAIEAEHDSKDWQKILLKFILWIAMLGITFFLIRRGRITPGVRKVLYLVSLTVFGVILGADPSAMGTIKDAVVLFAKKSVIFPPRMIALTVFLLLTILANKFFCSWGCQLGSLQDLIFRLNRDKKDKKSVFKQVKPPFAVTNGIRIAFFIVFTVVAFVWAMDIVEEVDPFRIYKPTVIGAVGWVFLVGVLVSSLFIYRPWCSMFCPFGLVGWLVEKQSLFKIKVNYDTCKACESCATVCPSTAMETILKRESTITDCFSCGSCINECPTGSITFGFGKRQKPPVDKFNKQS